MRLLFFGTSAFAVPSLEQVAGRHQVLRCFTQPERPQGRGQIPQPSPVKAAAQRLHVPVEEPGDLRALAAQFQPGSIDLGIVIAYGRILPRGLLEFPRLQMLGLHPSLLPRYRGANPIAWPILQGETVTGVTVFRLNERMDAGAIVLQRPWPIHPDDTAASLSERLAQEGAALLLEAIEQVEGGTVTACPQREDEATFTQKFSKADGLVDWAQPAVAIERRVRAAFPWPGAYTTWRGEPMKLWKTRCTSESAAAGCARPGEVVALAPEGITVATGDGALVMTELQPAGKRRMTSREFLAGHRMTIGEILGKQRER